MAPKHGNKQSSGGISNSTRGMIFLGLLGGVLSSLSFIVISHWPLPVSVAPYFGGRIGLLWGVIVGAIAGWILGYVTDDKHFEESGY